MKVLCLPSIHGNENIIEVIFVYPIAEPISTYITIGFTETWTFPTKRDTREPQIEVPLVALLDHSECSLCDLSLRFAEMQEL